jgi:hypothetical protein
MHTLEEQFHQNTEVFNSYSPEHTKNINFKKQTVIDV